MSPGGEIPSRGSWYSARRPVSRILSCAVIPLGAALLRTLISDLPGGFGNCLNHLAASGRCAAGTWFLAPASLPIWSCSVWGLPCLQHYCGSGALLPHLFTLTSAYPLARITAAVCSLWHWPSTGLEARVPDVIRHTALRSSDFPPPEPRLLKAPAATARSSCQLLVYREMDVTKRGMGFRTECICLRTSLR
jgi:hypothetical protein